MRLFLRFGPLIFSTLAFAQQSTQIVDTLYNPNGTLFKGVLLITPAPNCVMTNTGRAYARTTLKYCISTGGTDCDMTGPGPGQISLSLVPTTIASVTTPQTCSYVVNVSGNDGVTNNERWAVPPSPSPVGLAGIRIAGNPVIGPSVPVSVITSSFTSGCASWLPSGGLGQVACGGGGGGTPGGTNGQFQINNSGSFGGVSSIGTGLVVLQTSPTFLGIPLAPTASLGTNTQQLATTAFVRGQGYVDSALTYSNPSWITALAYAKITGAPVLPSDCDNPTTSKVLYDFTTNTYSCGVDQNSGGGGSSGGGGGYSQSFTSQTTVVLTHNLGTNNLSLTCFDGSENSIAPGPWAIGLTAPYNITVNFSVAQTGRCAVNGMGTYAAAFSGVTSITVPSATHRFGSCDRKIAVWDTSVPSKLVAPGDVTCNAGTLDIIISFAVAQSGRYVIQ